MRCPHQQLQYYLFFIQEVDGVYSCICPEGFTGEKCSTEVPTNASPRPRPQNREGPGGMSTAVIAGIVAGIVLAALICCVILTAAVVCVRLRRKKRTQSKYYTTSTPCILLYTFQCLPDSLVYMPDSLVCTILKLPLTLCKNK